MSNNQIKLIATDLDGTLLYPKKYLSLIDKDNVKFLSDFAKNGGKVVCITGRNPKLKHKIEKKIKSKIGYIGCNGGFTVDENDQIYDLNPLNNDIIMEIFNKYQDYEGIKCWLLFDLANGMLVYSKMNVALDLIVKAVGALRFSYRESLIFNKNKFINKIKTEKIYKLVINFGLGKTNFDDAYKFSKLLKENYRDKVNVVDSDSSIEITSVNATKALALQRYIEKQGIDKNEVYVVGDSGNDICLFKEFPHSFCMNHSHPRVKHHALHWVNKVSELSDYIYDDFINGEDLVRFNFKKKIL